jgi:hypothetical protein
MYLWDFSDFIIFSEGRIMTSQNSEYAQTTNSSEFMLPVMWRCVAGLVVPDVSTDVTIVKEYKILLGPPNSLTVEEEGTTTFLATRRRFL